uniref:Cation/H+ exchanger transmembrane domain-containing protein n=1 Tax=Strigamia maritima TaxID=126957 RepID=T1JIN7_STRMM
MMISHFILDFPWLWGLMLGFVLAAVSPAVVVPCLLALSDRNYGTRKGIPTLVIAAASIDDVLAIGGFGVVLAITFSTGNLTMTVLQGPIEVLIGIVYGSVIGLLLWFLPNKSNSHKVSLRSSLLFLTSVFGVLGSRVFDFAGSGPLACLIVSFVAAVQWRKEDEISLESIKYVYVFLWFVFQPFLFALIGAEINISSLDLNVIGYGVATLACGLTIRILVTSLAVLGAGLNWKERLFVALAWLPKATVQAAIGPIALDYARTKGHSDNSQEIELGNQILALAVLAIMITAPIGSALIVLSGPRLLERETEENQNKTNTESSNTQL